MTPRLLVVTADIPHARAHKRLRASMMILHCTMEEFLRAGWKLCVLVIVEPGNKNPELLAAFQEEMQRKGVEVLCWEVNSLMKQRKHTWDRYDTVPLPTEILQQIEDWKPDASYCMDILSASAVCDMPFPTSVQIHDLRYHVVWQHALYAARENWKNIFKLPMDWIRSRCWREMYQRVLKKCAVVHVIAWSSEREMHKLGVRAKFHPYAWPYVGSDRAPTMALPQKPTFLFLGNLSGLGSRSAFHFLFHSLYPELMRQWGPDGFSIVICGANTAPAWIMENIAARKEFDFRGFVPDIEALMQTCHAVIAPMDVIVANRSRIITALSLGSLVVAHKNTALGNPALVDGETCYLASDAKEFAENMRRAYERGPDVPRIIANGKHAYETLWKPQGNVPVLMNDMENAIRSFPSRA